MWRHSNMIDFNNIDINNICRSCLTSTGIMNSMSDTYEAGISVFDLYSAITLLECNGDNGLPMKICNACLSELSQAYAFVIKCRKSDKQVRNHLEKCINAKDTDTITTESVYNSSRDLSTPDVQSEIMSDFNSLLLSVLLRGNDLPTYSEFGIKLEKEIESLDDNSCESEVVYEMYNPDGKIDIINECEVNGESRTEVLNQTKNGVDFSKLINQESFIKKNGLSKRDKLFMNPIVVLERLDRTSYKYQNECKQKLNKNSKKRKTLKNNTKHNQKQQGTKGKSPIRKQTLDSSSALGKKLPTCTVCDKTFALSKYLTKHLRLTHNTDMKMYSCTVCNRSFHNDAALLRHIQICGKKAYSCDVCNKTLYSESKRTQHKQACHGQKPYLCLMCDETFSSQSDQTEHMKLHGNLRQIPCTICDESFVTTYQLNNHMLTHNDDLYSCGMCDKTFASITYLHYHMKTHRPMRPFPCNLCNSSYNSLPFLQRHKRKHMTSKLHACVICKKTFSSSTYLKEHINTHNSEKLFTCSLCTKTFVSPKYLKNHMKIHGDLCLKIMKDDAENSTEST